MVYDLDTTTGKGSPMIRSKIQAAITVALGVAAFAWPAAAYAEDWTNVALVDVNCSTKMKDNPDAHTRTCALKCAGSGYGIWTADGQYLKFDAEGSAKAKALLEGSEQADHLRVDVTGALADQTLTVASIALTKTSATP